MWSRLGSFNCERVEAPTLYPLGDSIEDWAHGVVDIAGDDPFVVVGNSVGGSCALEVAVLVPERVQAIVLVGAKAAHRPEPAFLEQAVQLLADGGMSAAWPVYWEPLFVERTDAAVVEAARRLAFEQPVTDIARGTRVFHTRPDRADFVRSWARPLIVVEGDQDRPQRGEALAGSAPRGEFHLTQRSGHYVPLEQPIDLQGVIERVLREATEASGLAERK